MTNPYTPEKVAEEITTAQKAVWTEIHGQDATRRYSVGEVKELVYSLDNAFSSAVTALTAVSADRDRLHKAITEALEVLTRGDNADSAGGAYRILRAALDKEGNDDD